MDATTVECSGCGEFLIGASPSEYARLYDSAAKDLPEGGNLRNVSIRVERKDGSVYFGWLTIIDAGRIPCPQCGAVMVIDDHRSDSPA